MLLINFINKVIILLNKMNNKSSSILKNLRYKLAVKYFKNNSYIKDYVNHFYDAFEYTYIDNAGFLNRCNTFDYSKIPAILKEDLQRFMNEYHNLYTEDENGGFCVGSYDNIYITYEHEIYSDFNRKNMPLYTSNGLELFLKLEQIQADAGIYPDIVCTDYYGQYYKDYTMPDAYKFLKTGMKQDEKLLRYYINQMIELYKPENIQYYTDNAIIENFTPDFIKKINNNLSIDINDITLCDDFNLSIEYEIPTLLYEQDLFKLNIHNFRFTTYKTTIIKIDVNIEDWLKSVISDKPEAIAA